MKICLEVPLGALKFMLQLNDKLGEFLAQEPPSKCPNAVPKWWTCRIEVLSAQQAPGL